jgi:hypothetical protein
MSGVQNGAWRTRWYTMVFRVCAVVVLAAVWSTTGLASEVPAGLSADDWEQIDTQLRARTYQVQPVAAGFVATNERHGLNLLFASTGTTEVRTTDDDTVRIGLRLRALGVGETSLTVADSPRLEGSGQTVRYIWSDHLVERWENSADGVEQWLELSARPAAGAGPLHLDFSLATDLRARLSADRHSLHLSDGTRTIDFTKLLVWDADGTVVSAELELTPTGVRYLIADGGARYPLTIDPTFTQAAYLKASNTDPGDLFGYSVAVSNDTVVVGAIIESSDATGVNDNDNNNSAGWAGAAYVFVRDEGGGWEQQAYLKASNTDRYDSFGWSVAVSGDTVVVGAPDEDSAAVGVNDNDNNNSARDAGAAYVFVRDEIGDWSQQAYLKASNTDSEDYFGKSVAVSGDTVVVGAYGEDSAETGVDGNDTDNSAIFSGAAYVFVRDAAGSWSQQAYLKASNTNLGDFFGWSVAVSNDTVVVGALREESDAVGVDGDDTDNTFEEAGAAYVFVRDGADNWSQQAYLKASNTDSGDFFGRSVAVSGDTVVVGAGGEDSAAVGVDNNDDDNSAEGAGAAYVFVRDEGGGWEQQAYLKASNTDSEDYFGRSVAVSGDTVVVGAAYEDSAAVGVDNNDGDNNASDAGAAYVFVRDAGGAWTQQAYLKASNTDSEDYFGISVAVSGDTVVVGAYHEDSDATGVDGGQNNNSATDAGAAYVFHPSSSFAWPMFLPAIISGSRGE